MPSTRRQFLAGAAGLAAMSAFTQRALAQSTEIPRRIIFVWTPHGAVRGRYFPMTSWASSGAVDDPNYTMPAALLPLEGFRSKMTIVDGLDMMSADLPDTINGANAHWHGTLHALTSAQPTASNVAGGPSFDYWLAEQLNTPTPKTAIRSLFMSPQHGGDGPTSWQGTTLGTPATGISVSNDLNQIYQQLASQASPADPSVSRRRRVRKSVLSRARAEFARISGQVSAADKVRFDSHASALADYERRMGVEPRSCTLPSMAITHSPEVWNTWPPETVDHSAHNAWFQAKMDKIARTIALYFACDLTRVITLTMPELPRLAYSASTANYPGTTDLHDLAHKTSFLNGTMRDDDAAVDLMTQHHRGYATHIAQIATQLDNILEADGKTALDHTVIVWCGEIADGSHDLKNMPYVLVGGAGGYLKTGTYIRSPRVQVLNTGGNWGDMYWWSRGLPHSKLFVTLAHAMGVQADTFGDPRLFAATCPARIGDQRVPLETLPGYGVGPWSMLRA